MIRKDGLIIVALAIKRFPGYALYNNMFSFLHTILLATTNISAPANIAITTAIIYNEKK